MSEIVRVAVSVAHSERESAIARLLELAPQGLEEVDRADVVELAAYVDDSAAAAIRSAFPASVTSEVEAGWEDRWREFHRPSRAGGIWLGPPWEAPPAGAPAVVIDPGRAFGTGAHPTTRLCVELLASLASRGSLLDVGCGSGVLSVAAARLGFGPIVAVDDDPIAVEVTKANAAANGVVVDVHVRDATAADLPQADVAVANIALLAVELVLPRLRSAVAITAGYLDTESPVVPGWRSVDRRELDGWAADVLEREQLEPRGARSSDRFDRLSS